MSRFWSGRGRRTVALVGAAVACSVVAACAGPGGAPEASAPGGPPEPAASLRPSTSASPEAQRTPAVTVGPGERAPADFVALSDVDPTILQDMRYATDHNFVGRRVDGYLEPVCILTRQTAEALHRAQVAAQARGFSLKMYDCYRPQRAVDDFTRWAKLPGDQKTKAEFYPAVDKSRLFHDGYIAGPTPHSRGLTVDLTLVALPAAAQRPYVSGEPLVSCSAPVGQRFGDNTVDMGTGFDCFDPRAATLDARVTGQPRSNRLLLKQFMDGAGFRNYSGEWWHYTLIGGPSKVTYYDFPVARAALTAR